MKIDLAKHERMSQTGSSLIKLIQNNNEPSLDLLVRESIQNSTDAAIDDKAGSINVEFNIIDFKTRGFSKHLEGIEVTLENKVKEEISTLIEIRDSNTTGLKGPIKYSDVVNNEFGNLLKLIYEISQPQQGEGTGGSWGLGKTVYFRIGIGLVVYYTRIKENGKYKSRLAACLVEDERKKDALLRNIKNECGIERGIAWWGEFIPGENNSSPITNESEIKRILDVLGVKLFENEETGTSIIIPYINQKELLKEVLFVENTRPENIPYWTKTIEDYLSIAIQKWYAVRVDNQSFAPGRWLKASVNGEVITKDEMLPLFQLIQELFNYSDRAKSKSKNLDRIVKEQIEVKNEDIYLNNIFDNGRLAGKVYFTQVNESQMSMGFPGYSKSPIAQIKNVEFKRENNDPIITFIRTPGMCVNYETSGSPWTSGIQKTDSNKYIIGIFIPNSKNTLTENKETITLEEYVRRSENADHMSWNDWTFNGKNYSIVRKIQNHVTRKVSNEFFAKDKKHSDVVNRGLGMILGDELLPPTNFGRRPTVPKTGIVSPPKRRNRPVKKASFNMFGEPSIIDNQTSLYYELRLPKKKGKYILEICISTEKKQVDASSWESANEIGGKFPVSLKRFSIFKVQYFKGEKEDLEYVEINEADTAHEKKSLELRLDKTKTFSTPFAVILSVLEDTEMVIDGALTFEYERKDVQIEINFKELEGE